jgi:acetyl esterase
MPLDPQAKAFLDQLAAANVPDVPAQTPREARMQMELGALMLGRPPKVARVDDLTIAGPGGALRARLTAPEIEAEAEAGAGAEAGGAVPGLVFFHGGGWVLGSIATHDHLCRAIANASGAAVVSVEYRLAPEHPYPAAVDDAEAATVWVAENARALGIDLRRLAVGGDSAGGNVAAVVARRARDRGGPPLALQVLIYPATDAAMSTRSYLENAEGYFLTRAAMAWYWDHYVPDPARRLDPDASPLRAASLAGLPPALVITAGHDPLRDEGEAYARGLAEAGVAVRHVAYPGMIHGFLRRHSVMDQGKAALGEIAAALRLLARVEVADQGPLTD